VWHALKAHTPAGPILDELWIAGAPSGLYAQRGVRVVCGMVDEGPCGRNECTGPHPRHFSWAVLPLKIVVSSHNWAIFVQCPPPDPETGPWPVLANWALANFRRGAMQSFPFQEVEGQVSKECQPLPSKENTRLGDLGVSSANCVSHANVFSPDPEFSTTDLFTRIRRRDFLQPFHWAWCGLLLPPS